MLDNDLADDEIYLCEKCLDLFLFDGDSDDHRERTSHTNMTKMKIDGAIKLDDKDYLLLEMR